MTDKKNKPAHSAPTEEKQNKPHLFQPGQSGNPKGREKGSRNKLSDDFLQDLYAVWKESGLDVLRRAAENKPTEFAKMVASLLPKEITVKNELSEFTDEQLAALAALAASLLGDAAGIDSKDREGSGSKARH
jgi:hypothetical protein